jgi:hypothetical protein
MTKQPLTAQSPNLVGEPNLPILRKIQWERQWGNSVGN